ncbi:hypothetical protein [Vibrio fluvialis]|uniref:hypothetical protein n=1 Tax=Vibrio fluvialis TaxID=676 RepID=UPI00257230C5|nr:hypothetical protein [Vibrio fluvialis]BEI23103.1 hypothetical protein KKIDH5335_14350 [Vibrio fluvialis]
MNLQEMLDRALAKVESITAEEFEQKCIDAGYTPIRKPSFVMVEEEVMLEFDYDYESLVGRMTYVQSNLINDINNIEIAADACGDFYNKLAA